MITYGHAGKGSGDLLYYDGRFLRVEWYRTADRRLPALDYYLGLAELDRERLGAMVMYMADNPPPGRFFRGAITGSRTRAGRSTPSSRATSVSSTSRPKADGSS